MTQAALLDTLNEVSQRTLISPLRVSVLDFASADAIWGALEDHGTVTPYQSRAWIDAFVRATVPGGRDALRIVVARDEKDAVAMLVPVVLMRWGALTVATIPGGKHSNFQMPAYGKAVPASAVILQDALREAGAQMGRVDLFRMIYSPLRWQGVANPLATFGTPSTSDGYKLALKPTGEATLAAVLGRDTRRKLRQKRRRIEGMGTLRHVVATSAPEAREKILAAFYSQKKNRMGARGLRDPFSDPAIKTFVEFAVCDGAHRRPAIELHALMLDDRVIATFAGTVSRDRFCGMFNSFDASETFARNSPGDQLLCDVIAYCADRGLQTFDLGIGDARYKESFCDARELVVDVAIPTSLRGALAAPIFLSSTLAKRTLKQSRLFQRIRG